MSMYLHVFIMHVYVYLYVLTCINMYLYDYHRTKLNVLKKYLKIMNMKLIYFVISTIFKYLNIHI